MSIGLNGYLDSGLNSQVLRDWQHAARLYVDDTYRLAPKPKFDLDFKTKSNPK
jgi:hypothetical protein